MEPARQALEDSLFKNEYTPVNTTVLKSTIPAFDSDAANTKVVKLNVNGNKTGPALVLKVMKGDQVQASSFAFYNTPVQQPTPGVNLVNDILSALAGGVINSSSGKFAIGSATDISNLLNPNITNFLNNRTYNNALPKGYLNFILVDEQFNYVSSNSGVVQVQAGASKQPLVAPLQTISKNGYLYVYVSNESPQDVFFDDITVKHTTGPLQQEQSFYPYGLQMSAISSKALLKTTDPYKYNAGSELEEELGYYNTFFRKYDAQIGRFTGVDILAESTTGLSPFHFGNNNPVMFNDPTGALSDPGTGRMQKGPDGNYHTPWVTEMLRENNSFGADGGVGFGGFGGGGFGGGGSSGDYSAFWSKAVPWFMKWLPDGQKTNFINGFDKNGNSVTSINYSYSLDDGYGSTNNSVFFGVKTFKNIGEGSKSMWGNPFLGGNGHAQAGGFDALKAIGNGNDVYGMSSGITEGIVGGSIILTNKMIPTSNVMKGIRIIKKVPAIGLIGDVSDALDVGLDAYNGDVKKAVMKSAVLILKNTIRFSSPVGFAVITAIDLGISAYDLYNDLNDD